MPQADELQYLFYFFNPPHHYVVPPAQGGEFIPRRVQVLLRWRSPRKGEVVKKIRFYVFFISNFLTTPAVGHPSTGGELLFHTDCNNSAPMGKWLRQQTKGVFWFVRFAERLA